MYSNASRPAVRRRRRRRQPNLQCKSRSVGTCTTDCQVRAQVSSKTGAAAQVATPHQWLWAFSCLHQSAQAMAFASPCMSLWQLRSPSRLQLGSTPGARVASMVLCIARPRINHSSKSRECVTQRRRAASVACDGLQLHACSEIVPKAGCRDMGPRLTLKSGSVEAARFLLRHASRQRQRHT